jgi:hypothetical protein
MQEITSAGASFLAAGISKNQGLVKLDLSDNLIQTRCGASVNVPDVILKMDVISARHFALPNKNLMHDGIHASHANGLVNRAGCQSTKE